MARLTPAPADGKVAGQVRARRGGQLRPIDQMLLHSPAVAQGWNQLLGAVRGGLSLSARYRELVILRVAVLNEAAYEWASHRAPAQEAGVTPAHLAGLRRPNAPADPIFDDTERRVLALCDFMTRDVAVPDGVFDALRADLNETALMELVTTVAVYNMVSRFAVALHVCDENSEVTR